MSAKLYIRRQQRKILVCCQDVRSRTIRSRFGLHPPPALSAKTALNPPIHLFSSKLVWRSPTDCQSSKKGVQNGLKVHIVVFETILQVSKLSFIKNLPTKLTNQLVTGEKSKAKLRDGCTPKMALPLSVFV